MICRSAVIYCNYCTFNHMSHGELERPLQKTDRGRAKKCGGRSQSQSQSQSQSLSVSVSLSRCRCRYRRRPDQIKSNADTPTLGFCPTSSCEYKLCDSSHSCTFPSRS